MATDPIPRQKVEPPKVDHEGLLLDLVNRAIKQEYIDHARKSGATEEWIDSLKDAHANTVAQVVSIVYGDPS